METNSHHAATKKNIGFTNSVCAGGICCFMSIPRKQTHLGIRKTLLRRRNASYGMKLLYSALQAKDIIYNPCKCLTFFLNEINTPNGSTLQLLFRCDIFEKKCRPRVCKDFPDKEDSFMRDVPAPCIYNEYRAPANYVKLKHKHVFRLFYAIRDDDTLLGKIFPGHTAKQTRDTLYQYHEVGKVSAIWGEAPAEYFLIEVPKIDSVLYTTQKHPRIESTQQAYRVWPGHIEGWLEKHYGSTWEKELNSAIGQDTP